MCGGVFDQCVENPFGRPEVFIDKRGDWSVDDLGLVTTYPSGWERIVAQ